MTEAEATTTTIKTEILGYTVPWIVSPGDQLEVKVSTNQPWYSHRLMRLIQGHEDPNYAPKRHEYISSVKEERHPGRHQVCHVGSYAKADLGVEAFQDLGPGLEFSVYMFPTLLDAGHNQVLVSTLDEENKTGFALLINPQNVLELRVGDGTSVVSLVTELAPQLKVWARVTVTFSFTPATDTDSVVVLQYAPVPVACGVAKIGSPVSHTQRLQSPAALSSRSGSGPQTLYLATGWIGGGVMGNCFNGRLDSPRLTSGSRVIVQYDFSQEIPSDSIVDVSGHGRHGVLVNAPIRAVKGHDWDATLFDWTQASYGYGAIHFHEDSLDDAAWATDFTLKLPADLRSGAYAVECTTDDGVTDHVTFFVRRRPGQAPATTTTTTAKVAFLASTYSYLAYANEHMWDWSGPSMWDKVAWNKTELFERLAARRDVGRSLYDKHVDGYGSVYVSSKRPLMNVRTGFVHWAFDRPRDFSNDLFMLDFLERQGVAYELITDHDLEEFGMAALEGIDTLISGAHPEYTSMRHLQCFDAFADRGGSLMYLGGNGFYWVTACDPARPHRIEVRRGIQGVRAFENPPGEYHHSLTGEFGGLWRARGHGPNLTVGVGSAGSGLGSGVPYRRTAASLHPDLAWMWAGIADHDLIGDFGGGASGDEIDRYEVALGSPPDAVVLATSLPQSALYNLFTEEIGFGVQTTNGANNPKVRSDMVFFHTRGGGFVFSVGSINWIWTMAWNCYDNNVAKLTSNVLHHFINHSRPKSP
ncbi:hypothetical protein A1O3_06731 [Capronia epimyces CBS 606.96]|uniref:N,N-dimethylformamidase beta subunit-like C-terminal domain-containing protein n=1 Tax=Capronia epimyces CBS 606.96 TaxID=1182542 RepID=W9XZY6_9EURO|nr:uncharacterized protein A1O3_06731 [Capronia epimyces CBS 606.96]EXJ82915.1 hypothetical protein A1O3_06731 [Capronia epimyces CBS 606.96]